jgi:hypothetical protein
MLMRPHDRRIDGMFLVGGRAKARPDLESGIPHPELLHRVKRTKVEFQSPYRLGMLRQGAPVRSTHRMPLTVRRLSFIGGPRSPQSGRSGSKMRHSQSVRSPRLKAASFRKGSLGIIYL